MKFNHARETAADALRVAGEDRGSETKLAAMAKLMAGHRWEREWERLPALAEEPARFLRSLEVFFYDVHRRFSESWGRGVVEAMLAGFHCAKRAEWRARARLLHEDAGLRARMSAAAG